MLRVPGRREKGVGKRPKFCQMWKKIMAGDVVLPAIGFECFLRRTDSVYYALRIKGNPYWELGRKVANR